MPVAGFIGFPLRTVSVGMPQLLLGHVAADGTMLVVFFRGGLRIPGVFRLIGLFSAGEALMPVAGFIGFPVTHSHTGVRSDNNRCGRGSENGSVCLYANLVGAVGQVRYLATGDGRPV